MANGRTDEQDFRLLNGRVDAASVFAACSAKPILASGHAAASKAEHITALVP